MKLKYFNSLSWFFILVFFIVFFAPYVDARTEQIIVPPEKYFGFKPGDDRMLFDYEALIGYLKKVDEASPRLKLVEIGQSPMGKRIYIAFISTKENINNLDNLKGINRKLALKPDIPMQERKKLIKNGKVFVLATLSMHSGEVGPSQAAPLIAYQLVTAKPHHILSWLGNVVFMMVPCHNPDGMNMIVNHYKEYKGTRYEGSYMPGVYHKYVGHDNNRDFVTLTQTDTRAIAAIYNLEWFPQVMVEKHQMMQWGVRYFVPPNHDPIAENIDASLWNWTAIFGSNMMKDMTIEGLAGVTRNYLFDDYWPGSTETCIWKNVIGFLTEAASCKYATPVFVESNELRAIGKGLSEYKKSINMPLPWPGGWWRLEDIVQYEIVSTLSILKTASNHRRDILRFRNDLCIKEVENGKTRPPYYYILPLKQHDQSELVNLVNLLKEHGVNVYCLKTSAVIEGYTYKKGDIVIPLSQPFRPFIKEVMESQEFPIRHYTPDGKVIKPYDITSWSLPLHRGVMAKEVNRIKISSGNLDSLLQKIDKPFFLTGKIPDQFWAALFTVNNNESFKAAFLAFSNGLKVLRLNKSVQMDGKEFPKGSFVVFPGPQKGKAMKTVLEQLTVSPKIIKEALELDAVPLKMPRIALIESYFHDMDAGWTRFILDTYSIPYKVIRPGDFETTNFTKNFDVVLFPDEEKSVLMDGREKYRGKYYVSSYPPQFTKGIGKDGMNRLMAFFDGGGIILSWGRSIHLFMGIQEITTSKKVKGKKNKENKDKEEFQLPVKDISEELKKEGFYCPGSMMRLLLLEDHPITLGMPVESGIFSRGQAVFSTFIPDFDMDRRVIGKFPEKNILLSGYCEKEEKLANKTAMVWVKKNKGQMVLFGFNPQFRASTNGTFKLLFNAILLQK